MSAGGVYHRRPLRRGDRIRLDPHSPARTVTHVNACGATVGGEPVEKEVHGKVFMAHGSVLTISRWAFVYPE